MQEDAAQPHEPEDDSELEYLDPRSFKSASPLPPEDAASSASLSQEPVSVRRNMGQRTTQTLARDLTKSLKQAKKAQCAWVVVRGLAPGVYPKM